MCIDKITSKLSALVVLAVFAFSPSAMAETVLDSGADSPSNLVFSLALVGQSQAKQVTEETLGDEFNIGIAALVEVPMGQYFGLETGALYVNRQYDVGSGSLRLVQEVKRLHVPLLAKVWLTDYFSLGAGPYVSLKLGSTKSAVQINGAEASLETSADRDLEIGYDISALFNLAINNKTGLFFEGRYSSPFDKKGDELASEVFGLVGVKLQIE